MSHTRTVYIIDDNLELIASLCWLLESMNYKVSSHLSVDDFLSLEQLAHPCCLLIDVRIPGTGGLELQDILINRGETAPIIFMSGHDDILTVLRAMKSGALEFLLKPINNQVLLENINKAMMLDQKHYTENQQRQYALSRFATLTSREHDILQLLVMNCSSKTIAKRLNISPNTVDLHRAKIIKKVQTKSLIDVVNLAWCAGIVDSKRYYVHDDIIELAKQG